MLLQIKYTADHICFFKGQTITFKPVTLLVGDQGCGKSTLLRDLGTMAPKCKEGSIQYTHAEDSKLEGYISYDSEKDSLRSKDPEEFAAEPELYQQSLLDRFVSHGEALKPMLKGLTVFENKLILIDEPETSLSLRSQYDFVDMIKTMQSKGNQVVIATHCVTFMEAFPDSIFNMETFRYSQLGAFKKAQGKPSKFKEKRDDRIIKKDHCSMGISCECSAKRGYYRNTCDNYINSRTGKRNGPSKGKRRSI